jgi:hypothetical protein
MFFFFGQSVLTVNILHDEMNFKHEFSLAEVFVLGINFFSSGWDVCKHTESVNIILFYVRLCCVRIILKPHDLTR